MSAQVITTEDLREFKTELIEEFKKILKEHSGIPNKKWLKSPDVRRILSISPSTLQTLRINGTLPYTRMGGALYYDTEDINKILQKNKKQNKLP